jgi:hypothetical protein
LIVFNVLTVLGPDEESRFCDINVNAPQMKRTMHTATW